MDKIFLIALKGIGVDDSSAWKDAVSSFIKNPKNFLEVLPYSVVESNVRQILSRRVPGFEDLSAEAQESISHQIAMATISLDSHGGKND